MPSVIAIAANRNDPIWLIEIDAGDTIRLGTDNVALSDRFFAAGILDVGDIGAAFDWNNFKYSHKAIEITLSNTLLLYGVRMSDLEQHLVLENVEVRLYAHFPGLDWSDISTDGIVARGLFKKNVQTTVRGAYQFAIEPYANCAWKEYPGVLINSDTWPNHRTDDGSGSVSGAVCPSVFGSHDGGLKAFCVDTTADKYVVSRLPMDSIDAVYDKDGTAIATGWTASNTLDGLGNLCAVIDFSADRTDDEPITAAGDGVADTTGKYTGTAGGLIETPASMARYLIDNNSTIGRTLVDDESWMSLQSFLPAIKMSSVCASQTYTGDFIDRLLYQCCLARADIVGGGHGAVFLDFDRPASLAIDTDLQAIGEVALSKTPRDLIVNSLRVEYNYSHGAGAYGSHFNRDRTNDVRCNDSYKKYGATEQKTIQFPDVGVLLQAEALTDRYLRFFASHNDLLSFNLSYYEGWDLRRGDCSEITIPSAPSIDGGGWSGEKCLLLEKYYLKNVIRTTWLKIRD